MPGNDGGGLKNFQRVQCLRRKAIQANEHKPIDIAEDEPLRRFPSQNNELLPKDENFRLQCRTRPE
jgi:hypothetical protein